MVLARSAQALCSLQPSWTTQKRQLCPDADVVLCLPTIHLGSLPPSVTATSRLNDRGRPGAEQ